MPKIKGLKQAFIVVHDTVGRLDDSFGLHELSEVLPAMSVGRLVGLHSFSWVDLSLLHMLSQPSESLPALLHMAVSRFQRLAMIEKDPMQVLSNSCWPKQVANPAQSRCGRALPKGTDRGGKTIYVKYLYQEKNR